MARQFAAFPAVAAFPAGLGRCGRVAYGGSSRCRLHGRPPRQRALGCAWSASGWSQADRQEFAQQRLARARAEVAASPSWSPVEALCPPGTCALVLVSNTIDSSLLRRPIAASSGQGYSSLSAARKDGSKDFAYLRPRRAIAQAGLGDTPCSVPQEQRHRRCRTRTEESARVPIKSTTRRYYCSF
jgi:hypothetical protein